MSQGRRGVAKFEGFPRQTLTFLRALSKHNDREWFSDHHDEYERYWLQPAKDCVVALGARLRTIAPAVQGVPQINGSIFRIFRDVRFSADKRPYKEHLDLFFWEGVDHRPGTPGFYVRLTPKALRLQVGARTLAADALPRYRAAVSDPKTAAALVLARAKIESAGYSIEGRLRKRVPPGYPPDHPQADLLRREGLVAELALTPLPAEVTTPAIVPLCMAHFRKLAPLHRWLADHLAA